MTVHNDGEWRGARLSLKCVLWLFTIVVYYHHHYYHPASSGDSPARSALEVYARFVEKKKSVV